METPLSETGESLQRKNISEKRHFGVVCYPFGTYVLEGYFGRPLDRRPVLFAVSPDGAVGAGARPVVAVGTVGQDPAGHALAIFRVAAAFAPLVALREVTAYCILLFTPRDEVEETDLSLSAENFPIYLCHK